MKSKFFSGTALVGVALLASACGSSGSSKTVTPPTVAAGASTTASSAGAPAAGAGSLIIGGADFSENTILAYVYGDALAAKGVKVSYKLNIGERAAYIAALKDGSIDFIPEYSGSILDFLVPTATAKSSADVDTALKAAATAAGYTTLQYAPAQDADTITVTKKTAAKYNLTTISSLVASAGKLTYGAPPNEATRADGLPGFKKVYGLTFGKFTPLAASGLITQTALKNGSVDAADIFSTDPSIITDDFVSLTDDKNVIAAQNIVPLVSTSKVTQTVTDVAAAVAPKLTTAELTKLDEQVQTEHKSEADVAKAWVAANGLS